ncbi:MAG: acyl-CoA dehydrogenase family protein [Gammaproteobacteria bacterium]
MKTNTAASEYSNKQGVTPGVVVQRTRDLVPILRQRAGQTETLRRLPDETVQDFRHAGLFRILQPARFGGHEMPLNALIDIATEAGRGCGSSGWCLSLLAAHNWLITLFHEEVQQEVFGDNPDTLVATSFAAQGKANQVPGGYRLSGRWQFSSGCDHSQWVTVVGTLEFGASTASDEARLFLLPRRDCQIDDTWFVAGLRGTGSKDIVVEDVFVPAHRTFSLAEAEAGTTPGAGTHVAPLYQLPFTAVLIMAAAGPALGIGLGALETYQEWMRSRVVTYSGAKMVHLAPVQIRLAESTADIDAAQLLLHRDCEAMMRIVTEGERLSVQQRARYRWDGAYAVALCTRAVDRLFAASGGHSLYDRHPLQRAFRDLHAMSAHAFLNPDVAGELFGRIALGLEPNGII